MLVIVDQRDRGWVSVRRLPILVLMIAAFVLTTGVVANGWYADFFSADASSNGTYEAMVINPEAVHDPANNLTYVVFQGPGLDPYITAYDHTADAWSATYRVGNNPLSDDMHGGPSLVIDTYGYLYVFFGGHNSSLRYARSIAPHRIDGWTSERMIRLEGDATDLRATYPQPWALPEGGIELFYRNHGASDADPRAGDWELARMSTEATWSASECVLDATAGDAGWYASSQHGSSDTLQVGFVLRDFEESLTNQFVRRDLFYVQRASAGEWVNILGESIGTTRTADVMEAKARIAETTDEYSNQVVVREAPDGNPALLYLSGTAETDGPCSWRYQRWTGSLWASSEIVQTDNLFDAADLTFDSAGAAHAYVVSGGLPDDQAMSGEENLAARGGDLEHWISDNGVDGWRLEETVKRSMDAATRYNNPQVIVGGDGDEVGLVFCEWNNDASSFIHKLFLYVDDRFIQREFTPDITRLAGDDRVQTATKISREAFPMGCDTVLIASARDYADALCGVPLAQSYRAPVLLCEPTRVPPALESELRRLKPSRVIILGGEVSLTPAVNSRLAQILPSAGIDRIAGVDRYETSAKIAVQLAERRGTPERVVVASGAGFADALSSSAYAARKGYPVLLSRPDTLPQVIEGVIASFAPDSAVIIGGPNALSPAVEAACVRLVPSVDRWWGANRYETAERVVEQSLAVGHTLGRPVIASGEVFADAVPGGLLAARFNSVIVLTRPDVVPAASARVLSKATRVIEAYVLGGPVAIDANVENSIASILQTVEAE
ncbi:MAG: cell wall-binding repeat-containing protein [Coriobacteriia bacterium]|nr:cell wall-binding repeat-containing protein [Coriobacteriia bacterium]